VHCGASGGWAETCASLIDPLSMIEGELPIQIGKDKEETAILQLYVCRRVVVRDLILRETVKQLRLVLGLS
jgi:hypothetical protein